MTGWGEFVWFTSSVVTEVRKCLFIRDSSPMGTDTELEKLKMAKVPCPRYELNATLAYIRRLLQRYVCAVATHIARFM